MLKLYLVLEGWNQALFSLQTELLLSCESCLYVEKSFLGTWCLVKLYLLQGYREVSPWAVLSILLSLEQEAKTSGGKEWTAWWSSNGLVKVPRVQLEMQKLISSSSCALTWMARLSSRVLILSCCGVSLGRSKVFYFRVSPDTRYILCSGWEIK